MLIKTKITEKDYIQASLTLLYTRLAIKIITGFGIFLLLIEILSPVILPGQPWLHANIFTPVLFIAFLPGFTWFTAKKNYTANRRMGETTEYEFDKEYLIIKGESFSTQLTWEKIYKVTETKKWVFIWQTPQIANIIAKRDIWGGDILQLKDTLDNYNVKNTLKEL